MKASLRIEVRTYLPSRKCSALYPKPVISARHLARAATYGLSPRFNWRIVSINNVRKDIKALGIGLTTDAVGKLVQTCDIELWHIREDGQQLIIKRQRFGSQNFEGETDAAARKTDQTFDIIRRKFWRLNASGSFSYVWYQAARAAARGSANGWSAATRRAL